MQHHELVNETERAALRLWTSAEKYRNKFELCHIINAAIRADGPDELISATAKVARAINMLLVSIRRGGAPAAFPPRGMVFRGSVIPDEHLHFFEERDKKFRVPGFFPTSFSQDKARWFANRSARSAGNAGSKRVVWVVQVDPAGETDEMMLCQNANYVNATHVQGEQEYLFTQYSVFQVTNWEWSDDVRGFHTVQLTAMHDNQDEDEGLPLAPWY